VEADLSSSSAGSAATDDATSGGGSAGGGLAAISVSELRKSFGDVDALAGGIIKAKELFGAD